MRGRILSNDPSADLPATAAVRSISLSDDHVRLEVESFDHELRSVDLDLLSAAREERPGVVQKIVRKGRPLAAVITLRAGVLNCSVLQRGVGSSPVEVGLRTVRDLHEQGVRTVLRVVPSRRDGLRSH